MFPGPFNLRLTSTPGDLEEVTSESKIFCPLTKNIGPLRDYFSLPKGHDLPELANRKTKARFKEF
jgi:hypothetical protein